MAPSKDAAEASNPARCAEKKADLAQVVRRLQRRNTRVPDGKNWAEWVQARHPPQTSESENLPPHARGKGRDSKGRGKGQAGPRGPGLDPRLHDTDTLQAFLAELSPEDASLAQHEAKCLRKSRRSLATLRQALGVTDTAGSPLNAEATRAARFLKMLEHTRNHQSFESTYGLLPSHRPGWVWAAAASAPAPDTPVAIEDLVLSIDCEMVATASDSGALARVSVVNGANEVLIDKLVAPDETPTDLRTHVTGIEASDLAGLEYTRSDAQADVLRLLTPWTVLVGHTLHKDLAALHMDAPLVVDVGLLYGLEGLPTRKPGLAFLVESVLGQVSFREGGQAVHSSVQDAIATLQLFFHRLRLPKEDVDIVWLPPPLGPEASEDSRRTLLAHRLPDRPDVFAALVSLFTKTSSGSAGSGLEAVEMGKSKSGMSTTGAASVRSAKIVFSTPAHAERAFAALRCAPVRLAGGANDRRAAAVGRDRAGRPQKLIELSFGQGDSAVVYVRTLTIPEVHIQAKQSQAEPPRWAGWKRAIDDELSAAHGAMPWKRLRDAVVARWHGSRGTENADGSNAASDDELGLHALACIPDAYLSQEDALVRAPKAAVQS